jgi:hypothetical protein
LQPADSSRLVDSLSALGTSQGSLLILTRQPLEEVNGYLGLGRATSRAIPASRRDIEPVATHHALCGHYGSIEIFASHVLSARIRTQSGKDDDVSIRCSRLLSSLAHKIDVGTRVQL